MYFVGSASSSSSSGRQKPKIMNSFCTNKCMEGMIDNKLQCNCGEDVALFDWTWQDLEAKNIKMSKDNKEVLFHPTYSSGTAYALGQYPFKQNYHYYWEIKIVSRLYGTDVMIGIGTSKITLEDWNLQFCSLLGINSESWGYSYQGHIQHNTLKRKYGSPFGLGSIIGLHLDMCQGTLEYFLNRKPLGIAFRDLKGIELYPMVSSTAAQSSMRITCAVSKEASLQMTSLKLIMNYPEVYKQYKTIPGLARIYEKQYFWLKPKYLNEESLERKRLAELDEDITLSLVDKSYLVKNKKLRRIIRVISEMYDESEFNIYDDIDDEPSALGNSESSSKKDDSCPLCVNSDSESEIKLTEIL